MKNTMKKRFTQLAFLAVLALAMTATPGLGELKPVDINTATAAELATINGIGPAKAKAIVDHREQHGTFANVEDLRSVSGIGDKLLDRMRSQVTVGAPQEANKKADQSE